MEYLPSLQHGIDDLKPSLFELLSEQQLASLLPPSLRYLLAISTHRYPRYLLPVLNSFDEVYALLMLVVERHFLRTYGGSFTENFYNLKRTRVPTTKGGELPRAQLGASEYVRQATKLDDAQIRRNLTVLVGVPWLKRKLDEGYDVHAAHANILGSGHARRHTDDATVRGRLLRYYKWFLRNVYPSVNAAYYFSMLAFNMAYLFDGSMYHSPMLYLIGTRIRRMSAVDFRAIELAAQSSKPGPARPGEGGSILAPRNVVRAIRPRLTSTLKILLPTSIFALKFLEWWYASDFARQLSRKAAENIELPPPLPLNAPQAQPATSVAAERRKRHEDIRPLGQLGKAFSPVAAKSLLPIFTVPRPSDTSLCPICTSSIVTPTASPTGFVYCYKCIHQWVEGSHSRQVAFMEGAVGLLCGTVGDDQQSWGNEEGSREGKWESGRGRDAITGRRLLGGTEALRRVII